MKFADIPFHDDAKRRLRSMVDSAHIPHALLLEGPSGVGKMLLARAYAQYIHCSDRTPEGDSCGKCPSCVQHEKFNHIDTFYSFPVLKKSGSAAISSDYFAEFRELIAESPFMDFDIWLSKLGNINGQPAIYVDEIGSLIERMNLTPRQSKYKIVIMWLPERLQESAANKLLKLLEEPHGDTLFILTSDNPSNILPTIYSRTQRVAVRRYADSQVAHVLAAGGIDSDAALAAASLAEGSVSTALRSVSTDSNTAVYLDLFIRLMRAAWIKKVADLRKISNEIAEMGRERSARFYEYCSRMIRENFIMNLGDLSLNSLTANEASFSVRFSPFINAPNVLDIAKVLDDARRDTLLNANARIVAFDLAVKMILLIKRVTDQAK